MSEFRIAIFASGNGTNAEAIIRYFASHPTIKVVLLLTNNDKAFVLQRAKALNVKSRFFTREQFSKSDEVINWLKEDKITHIVLAGFLWLIPRNLIKAFPDKIINIHPALLPKFGGKGMYGAKVHDAVKAANEMETGITIHLVNERYDDGKILFQEKCAVESDYTPEQIAQCVHQLEYKYYPQIIERWVLN